MWLLGTSSWPLGQQQPVNLRAVSLVPVLASETELAPDPHMSWLWGYTVTALVV